MEITDCAARLFGQHDQLVLEQISQALRSLEALYGTFKKVLVKGQKAMVAG